MTRATSDQQDQAKRGYQKLIDGVQAEWQVSAPRGAAAIQFVTSWRAFFYWLAVTVALLVLPFDITRGAGKLALIVLNLYFVLIVLRLGYFFISSFVMPLPKLPTTDYGEQCRRIMAGEKIDVDQGAGTREPANAPPRITIAPSTPAPAPRPTPTPAPPAESAPGAPAGPKKAAPYVAPEQQVFDTIKRTIDVAAVALAAQQKNRPAPLSREQIIERISGRIIGQDRAVDAVVSHVARRAYARYQTGGTKGPQKPLASFMLLGPTGVGKSQLCKELAKVLYPDSKRSFLTFDMGQFDSAHNVSRLIGSPPGYVGSQDGGQLTRPLITEGSRKIVLFDEIEKAHPDVNKIFLSLLDEGRLTEQGSGQEARLDEAIIFFTSNLLWQQLEKGELPDEEVKRMLKTSGKLAPELIARIDKFVIFRPLDISMAAQIVVNIITDHCKQYGMAFVGIADGGEVYIGREIMGSVDLAFGVRELQVRTEAIITDRLIELHQQGAREVILTADGITPAEGRA